MTHIGGQDSMGLFGIWIFISNLPCNGMSIIKFLYESSTASSKQTRAATIGILFVRKNIAYPDATIIFYHYRAYSDRTIPKVEYLGIKTTTPEFNGVFLNSATQAVSLQYMKNGVTYVVTLEPDTFSLLSSDSWVKNSIRPQRSAKIVH